LSETPSALELSGISKRFGAVVALDGASVTVRPGTVHALLGENGAGKTTLMRIAFGMVRPDAGRITVRGIRATWTSPADAIGAGIGMVHQHFTLVPAMTVAENVELGDRGRGGGGGQRGWRLNKEVVEDHVRELGRTSGLLVEPGARVAELSVAAQQRVEILKALSRSARILILDEPTAVLAPQESEELARWLRAYALAGGAAVLITHKLREALAVSDDVTVLRRGRTVLAAPASAVDPNSLTRAMIGDAMVGQETTLPGITRSIEESQAGSAYVFRAIPVVVADDVEATDEYGRRETVRASFVVHAGEIVGIVGVEGAGQRTLLRVLAGRIAPSAGRLTRPAVVGFIPEDRHEDALVLEFSLAENVALRGLGGRRGRMNWPAIRRRTAELMREFDVRAPGVAVSARTLSGGNQQRLVLARELDGGPPLLVAENPTRGLDVRSTAQVQQRLRAASEAGTAVVLYSSDLDEVLALATRVLVVHAGTVREVPWEQRDLIGRAMLGLP
jgi:general nucleoside transport system ATP-binding protein